MKQMLFLASIAALLVSCTIATPGPSTISELMAPFVAEYGPPTGAGPVPPIYYGGDHLRTAPDPQRPNEMQTWTWFPVQTNKTLTVNAFYWRADWSDNYAWKVVQIIE